MLQPAPGLPNTQNQVQVLNNSPAEPTALQIQAPVAIVIDRATATNPNIGLSVSEPIGGYPVGSAAVPPAEPTYSPPFDIPFDTDPNKNPLQPTNSSLWRYVHLQRLADPTQQWNPERYLADGITQHPNYNQGLPVNPYLTIDTAPIALVVFEGAQQAAGQPAGISSVQRGDTQVQSVNSLFWHTEPTPVPSPQR